MVVSALDNQKSERGSATTMSSSMYEWTSERIARSGTGTGFEFAGVRDQSRCSLDPPEVVMKFPIEPAQSNTGVYQENCDGKVVRESNIRLKYLEAKISAMPRESRGQRSEFIPNDVVRPLE